MEASGGTGVEGEWYLVGSIGGITHNAQPPDPVVVVVVVVGSGLAPACSVSFDSHNVHIRG